MSDTPSTEPENPADEPETPAEPDATGPSPAPAGRKLLRWATFAVSAVALIAIGLVIAVWFGLLPGHSASSKFTDQQIADAKSKVCAASMTVRQAVVTNTHLSNPVPGDPIGALAVAANARLALYGVGGYLRDRLAVEPASPADLAKAINAMANTLQELSIGYLAGAPNYTQDPLRRDLNSELDQITGLCR
jgi:hypothetical protein